MTELILAIDQGTTSSRAMVFDAQGQMVSSAQEEFPQIYPAPGWVEHDPEEIWRTTLETAHRAFELAEAQGGRVIGIGVTNQRETTILWDRRTGKPIYNAIVWQDRRTADVCRKLSKSEAIVRKKTGLLLDPYFSATKIAWILDRVDGARALAKNGDLAFGTVDAWLIHRLTGGRAHVTDATNASRTSLYDIHAGAWDEELCKLFRVPASVLPVVKDCADDFGETDASLFGRQIRIRGVAGDQQAALAGQACFAPGAVKSTYGTGCFVVMNTGAKPLQSKNRLLTTVGYRLKGKTTYALEGSIFVAGAAVQWLRDGLKIVRHASETEGLARGLSDTGGVYMVPAFTGLGAPHWDAEARGALFGLTRATGAAEITRAVLESVVYQTADLFDAMAADGCTPSEVRVDGGMVANGWLCQFLADVLNLPVDRPAVTETTALGAAAFAGLQAGLFASLDEFAEHRQSNARFEPDMEESVRASLLEGWRDAVRRTLSNTGKA